MKHTSLVILVKSSLVIIICVIMVFAFSSCATRKASFQISSVVPAAEGYVKVKEDGNKNYAIRIEVKNLAEPGRLQPPKLAYIVWMEAENNTTKNIGQIKTSTAFLSKKLTASFETVSPLKPIRIFITAEDDAAIQYPYGQTVLSTNNF